MLKEITTSMPERRKKETTVREVVVGRVKLVYALCGLEKAMKKYEQMKEELSDLTPEWSDVADEVMKFFLEKKREEQRVAGEREKEINQMWADALKNGIVTNQLNLMPGNNPQAPYYSSTQAKTKGVNNEQRRTE